MNNRRKMAAVAPPSANQLAWRRRIEAVLRVAAPALDLLLAAGDRFSRAVELVVAAVHRARHAVADGEQQVEGGRDDPQAGLDAPAPCELGRGGRRHGAES